MNAMQPSSSLELDLGRTDGVRLDTDPEAFIAKRLSESPTGEIRLMESILELDKELERRGLQFVRYADDCVIHVGSKRAGDRVKESITRNPGTQ